MTTKRAIILSVFPACGKTYVYKHQKELGISVLDSDSSEFSWMQRKRTTEELEEIKRNYNSTYHLITAYEYINRIKDQLIKVRNPEFPANYVKHIKEQMKSGKYDFIFVSSHESVREALKNENIKYTIVCPNINMKEEWIGRCYLRELEGKNLFPIKVLIDNWDTWMKQLIDEITHYENGIFLKPGEHLSDIINYIRFVPEKYV